MARLNTLKGRFCPAGRMFDTPRLVINRPNDVSHRECNGRRESTYFQVRDMWLSLSSVAIAVGERGGGGQLVGGDASRVPVSPVNLVRLDVKVHGVDAHICIALEDLLVAPVWHRRVQAPYFIVVRDIENLPLGWRDAEKQMREQETTTNQSPRWK